MNPSDNYSALMETLAQRPLDAFMDPPVCYTDARQLFEDLRHAPFDDDRWAFRGHAEEKWPLCPLIERIFLDYQKNAYEQHKLNTEGLARYAIREFRRRAHHFVSDLPGQEEPVEWLALMRHHGAPTKLLDWTRSPYVAAFFATSDARNTNSAVWAIDRVSIDYEARRMLNQPQIRSIDIPEHLSGINHQPLPTAPPVVFFVWPFRMNQRLTSQQGLFLCQNTLRWSFENCLKHVLHSARENRKLTEPLLYKFITSSSVRLEILRELQKMNISDATLFPGLDGFARSLKTALAIRSAEACDPTYCFEEEP